MAGTRQFDSGDHVCWRAGQGKATGWVLRKAICRLGVSGRLFEASPQAPRFLVRRDDNGELTVIAPGALHLLQN